MVSEKKLEANRRNAEKSTGPKTEEGKAKSSQNALTHGIFAIQFHILPGENEAEYAAFHGDVLRDLAPCGVIQREMVDDIVQTRWRLRRLSKLEAHSILEAYAKILKDHEWKNDRKRIVPPPPPLDPIKILAQQDGGATYLDLYRERLQRMFHTQLRELRKLRDETGQNEDLLPTENNSTCTTGFQPVPSPVSEAPGHGLETRATEDTENAPRKNEPTAERKPAAEHQLDTRHVCVSSAVNAVADSLMLSMDDLTEAKRSIGTIDRPLSE